MSLADAPNIRLSLLCDSGPRLCVQVDAPPYRYVSVEGPVDIVGSLDVERDVRPMARRARGVEGGDRYLSKTAEEWRGDVLVILRPARWRTVDYRKWPAGHA